VQTAAVTTLVLVHGAWHGAWAWDLLESELRLREVGVRTVQLPTAGDAGAGLDDDVAVLRGAVTAIAGPVVLVGHSYGGVVITEAADGLQQVQRLVYVTAFMPDVGESLLDLVTYGPLDWIVPAGEGLLGVAEGRARNVFYGDVDPVTAAQAEARLRPQAASSFGQPVRAAAWRAVPSTYLVGTEDRAIPPAAQRTWSARASETVELATSHSPFLAQPSVLAELLSARLPRGGR